MFSKDPLTSDNLTTGRHHDTKKVAANTIKKVGTSFSDRTSVSNGISGTNKASSGSAEYIQQSTYADTDTKQRRFSWEQSDQEPARENSNQTYRNTFERQTTSAGESQGYLFMKSFPVTPDFRLLAGTGRHSSLKRKRKQMNL